MLPYRSEEEFRDRYLHTVIYFKGEPVYIQDVYPGRSRDPDRNGEVKLIFTKLPHVYDGENKQFREPATHEDFTDSFESLGYTNAFSLPTSNYEDVVKFGAYLTRMPIRRNKQGLFSENLHIPRNGGKSFLDLLYSPEFVAMLTGQYPSFKQLKETITTDRNRFGVMGFSKQFAVEFNKLDQLVLYCKSEPIGFSLDGGDKFTLIKSKHWLSQCVEEKGLKVA